MIFNEIKIITKNGDTFTPQKSIIALGTFDGVHIAHRALLERSVSLARKSNLLAGAWCFSDIPTIQSKTSLSSLSTLDERVRMIFECGVDFVAIGKFEDLHDVTAEDFIEKILKDTLCAVGAVCGFNHRFGKGASGSPELLCSKFSAENVSIIPKISIMDETVSSSAIRNHIANGNIETANRMLGHRFSLTSPVLEGKKLGRRLGFPTVNQMFDDNKIKPQRGIYATLCYVRGKRYIGVSNVGTRPTITDGSDSHTPNCETYIIGFSDEIYGENVKIEFSAYLREEKHFDSIEHLRCAIADDEKKAIEHFKALGIC